MKMRMKRRRERGSRIWEGSRAGMGVEVGGFADFG